MVFPSLPTNNPLGRENFLFLTMVLGKNPIAIHFLPVSHSRNCNRALKVVSRTLTKVESCESNEKVGKSGYLNDTEYRPNDTFVFACTRKVSETSEVWRWKRKFLSQVKKVVEVKKRLFWLQQQSSFDEVVTFSFFLPGSSLLVTLRAFFLPRKSLLPIVVVHLHHNILFPNCPYWQGNHVTSERWESWKWLS